MRVGFILECGPKGADIKVCEYLARQVAPDFELISIPLGDKPTLVNECGPAAAALLSTGCERVLIIWDLFPAWRERGRKPCRRKDRESILHSLAEAQVVPAQVSFVCIREELEAWLIADERAVSAVLSTAAHPFRCPFTKNPERRQNPKKHLMRLYSQRGRAYVDHIEAERIIRACPDLTRLRRGCPTFARFEAKLVGE